MAEHPKPHEFEAPRDRIWSEQEKNAIFTALKNRKSHLYWPVYFMSMNPIRKGDLVNLTREKLNLFKPEVHFFPQKTSKRKPRESHLICIDDPLLTYFKNLPADCPFLFPRIEGKENLKYYPLGDPKKEWHAVLLDDMKILIEDKMNKFEAEKIKEIKIHDLKHCSITFMLDKGFRELDLRNLGIQYTTNMVRRYYHEDENKALGTWQRIRDTIGVVAPECGPSAQKMV